MKPVTVGRYDAPQDWLGWVETEDWAIFQHGDGSLHCFNGREPNGAISELAASAILRPDGQVVMLVTGA